MARTPVRYIPCRSNMKSVVAARNQERPGIVPGLKEIYNQRLNQTKRRKI
jgi:hypothetical protein